MGRVLFTDEARFLLRSVDSQARVFRRREERFRENCILPHGRYGGGSLVVWAGIRAHLTTDLVFLNGTLNAKKYCQDILARHIVPFTRVSAG